MISCYNGKIEIRDNFHDEINWQFSINEVIRYFFNKGLKIDFFVVR